jgi:6-phosphogluconate dehydrogenase
MELGMIGLGRMGANMAQRLLRGGHHVVGFDPKAEARAALAGNGGGDADSLQALVAALPAPRTLWMMVPAGKITDDTLDALCGLLEPGDTIIDGGNSNYKDILRRACLCAGRQLLYVDWGTIGGVWGL